MGYYCPRGVKEGAEILSRGKKFLVYYDPDVDGAISGYFGCKFLMHYNKPYSYYINENRAHGFFLPPESVKGYTVIAVDFSISNFEELVLSGVDIVNIDHHSISSDKLVTVYRDGVLSGVVINNQYSFEPEEYRFLSGAGVVYYALGHMCRELWNEENAALVGISLLTDVRAIESDLARSFLKVTYESKTPMIKNLIENTKPDHDYGFGELCMDMNYIDYTFSPKINAAFRMNKGYLVIDMLLHGANHREAFNILRNAQNEVIADILESSECTDYGGIIYARVDLENLNEYREFAITNFTGVACSRIEEHGGKSAILCMYRHGDIVRGSCRGIKDTVKYLDIVRSIGIPADGHANAFGIHACAEFSTVLPQLSTLVADAETNSTEKTETILEVPNLSVWASLNNKKIALYNIYTRGYKRAYLKYTGKNWKKTAVGKMWVVDIDGISVKCFDADLTPENGYIMPMLDRGYPVYYMKKLFR